MPKDKSISGVFDLEQRGQAAELGEESKTLAGTAVFPAPAGKVIYCLKPLGATATIGAALDINGVAITELVGIVLQQGDEYKKALSSITFSTNSVAVEVYYRDTFINFLATQ